MIGFLGVDGVSYPCKPFKHIDAASEIVLNKYNMRVNGAKAEQLLLDLGWLEFRTDEVIFNATNSEGDNNFLTPSQKLTLYKWVSSSCSICSAKQQLLLKDIIKHDDMLREGVLSAM